MLGSCQWHGSLGVRRKSESSDCSHEKRACCDVSQGISKLGGLLERMIMMRRMSNEVLMSSLALVAYIPCVKSMRAPR